MPWTPQSFGDKHNKGLSPSQRVKAAQIANDLLEKGMSDAQSIRIANSVVQRRLTKGKK